MNKQEKIRFVKQLCNGMAEGIAEQIKAGKIPENWDGIELRWLVAERAQVNARFFDKRRKRDFDNTVIVNNL